VALDPLQFLWLSTGSVRNNTTFLKLKMAVFAPIPSASDITATAGSGLF
jgi:hypothetical protein